MRPWILCLCAVAVVVACFYAATSRTSIPPISSVPGGFDKTLISQGEALAAIGNCDSCHTADGGARLAGGRAAGMMPGFDGAIGNADLAALLTFLRARFSDEAAWGNLESRIEAARRELQEAGKP